MRSLLHTILSPFYFSGNFFAGPLTIRPDFGLFNVFGMEVFQEPTSPLACLFPFLRLRIIDHRGTSPAEATHRCISLTILFPPFFRLFSCFHFPHCLVFLVSGSQRGPRTSICFLWRPSPPNLQFLHITLPPLESLFFFFFPKIPPSLSPTH